MTWLSLARFEAFTMRAFDLGAMSQAIWRTTQGDPLISTVEGVAFSRLARHVELFYFVLAPLYALRPSPTTLLILQSTLYTLGALPVYILSLRQLQSRWAATVVAAIYLFYPVAQTAVLFEFHADTLAMPLLLFAIEAIDRDAHISYWIWLFMALSCKFYVAVPVLILGLVLWCYGRRNVGLLTVLVGILWLGLTLGVIRPYFSPQEAELMKATTASYFNRYFGHLNLTATGLIRLSNGIIVVAPVLLLAVHAPLWLLPALSITVPAMISAGPGPSYDYRFHHYALAVPFLVASCIYGANVVQLERKSGTRRVSWQRSVLISFALTLILNGVLINSPLNLEFYKKAPGSGFGMDPLAGLYVSERDKFKLDWLEALVIGDKPIAANRLLAYRLVNREILYRVPPFLKPLDLILEEVDLVLVDALYDYALLNAGRLEYGVKTDHETIQELMKNPIWGVIEAQDGLLVFSQTGDMVKQGYKLIPFEGNERPFLAQFGDKIELLDAELERISNNQFRLRCDWVALRSLTNQHQLIAVSRPEGIAHARIPHLPTLGLLPTNEWPTNQIVREEFEFTLPDDTPSGSYPLWVSWYDTGSLYAAETDGRSRVGAEFMIGVLLVGDE